MTTEKLITSVTADSPKGQRAVETFRAQYNKARLNDEAAQNLNESGDFAAYLAEGIRRFSTRGPVFPVYLDIEVGSKSTHELFHPRLFGPVTFHQWATDLMHNPAWRPSKKELVKFGRAAIQDLGFTENPMTFEIWTRIRELGHALCESGDGPELALADKDQPHGDKYFCAMEQLTSDYGRPEVFCVYRHSDGNRWLESRPANPDRVWSLDVEIAFRLRK